MTGRGRGSEVTLDEFFAGFRMSRELFEALAPRIDSLGEVTRRVTKSQVAWRRDVGFAWAWVPERYLPNRGLAPLVLTVGLRRRDASSRFKQVVEVSPGRFVHHLELYSVTQLDAEMDAWLREAWEQAG
jgi:hypothetical protein